VVASLALAGAPALMQDAMTQGASAQALAPNAQIARGDYLVNGPMGCGNCHTQKNADLTPITTLALAGGQKFNAPFGLSFSKNLTPDVDTGIGSWSTPEIVRAIREGVSKEGAVLGPPMPVRFYNKLSDEDANAIAAYLKSLKPIRNEVGEAKYKVPLQPQPPAAGVTAPPRTDKVAYGGYVANAAHCFECHTAPGPNVALGSGGRPFAPIEGKPIRTPNITSDPETGIGAWTDDQIKAALTKGIDKDGRQLIPLMPYPFLKNMTPEDLDAVVAFLRTVPAAKNAVPRNPSLQTYLQ
jgi:mono/diheme cytochrome c family protein